MSINENQTRSSEASPPWAAGTEMRHHELYPELTADEIDIVRQYGIEREVADGTVLWDIGDRNTGFFLTLNGEVEVFRRDKDGEQSIITHGPGHYGGETVTMSGRGALLAGRANGYTRVLVVNTEKLRELIATEATLGEKILHSFILRRMRMIAEQLVSIKLVGFGGERDTARIRMFLTRNEVPHEVIDLGNVEDVKKSLRAVDATAEDLPLLLCDGRRLSKPSNREIAESLGFATELSADVEFDVAVIGAGPAGLAAAVYAASEGLSVIVFESCAPGGQAGTTSKIENYLGFPTGISGQALAGRAYNQAQKFGAEIAVARKLIALRCGDPCHDLELDGGDRIKARSVVIASGAVYKQPPIEGLDAFDGSGVHYGASHVEAQFCHGKDIVIIGGGNSAGQAAVHLSAHARAVHIAVREAGLAESMSNYLIRRIDKIGNIEVLSCSEIQRVEGEDQISTIVIRDNRTGEMQRLNASHLFIFIGATPATDFVGDGLVLDDNGFVKTGDALTADDLHIAGWPFERRPYLLEASCPRIFAAGDVRSGSGKRVASAVGEGSTCVQFIHQTLTESHGDD
ncbi:MAG: FAD-dependent oxidoreductase [Pyrinomonadaceae bacterium]|nr:FAD-dependent oxidoreductase [Gammaproteobacteria bacterium]MBA3572308.1 FAD-dependent oxidoreductase [Pyrinomonadaceae bacterium]